MCSRCLAFADNISVTCNLLNGISRELVSGEIYLVMARESYVLKQTIFLTHFTGWRRCQKLINGCLFPTSRFLSRPVCFGRGVFEFPPVKVRCWPICWLLHRMWHHCRNFTPDLRQNGSIGMINGLREVFQKYCFQKCMASDANFNTGI